MKPSQLVVQTLAWINNTFYNDIIPNILTTAAFNFYFNNEELVNSTVFMYDNVVTPEQSIQLWNDPEYGWSKYFNLFGH
jgi:hypothetical protein